MVDADFTSIRVSTLRGDQKIDFNAYVKINEKMILYLRQGDSFEGGRLGRLKEKKLKKMFIRTDEEPQYREYLERNIQQAYDKNSKVDLQTRSEVIHGQQQSNAEEVFEHPEDKESYMNTKEAAGQYLQFIQTNADAALAILKLENTDQNLGHHGVSVSTLALKLAAANGMKDPGQTQMLILGALLHDIGHFETKYDLSKVPDTLSKEEYEAYCQHPRIGAERVQDKQHFDIQVVKIIAQHEELTNGSGFPFNLTEATIDPLALIVGTCNALDRMISFEKIPPREAIKKMMIERMGVYPLNFMKKLSDIVREVHKV